MAKPKHKMIEGIDYKNNLCSIKSKVFYLTQRLEQLAIAKRLNNEYGTSWEEIKLQLEIELLSKHL